MTSYEKLLRERIEMRTIDLYKLDETNGRGSESHFVSQWGAWNKAVETSDMSIETLEQLCVELACQMYAFSSKRMPHLPILAAFNDRAACERSERNVLLKIQDGCAE